MVLRYSVWTGAKDYLSWTPLCQAAKSDRLAVAELLLGFRADPGARDSQDRTPLDGVVSGRHVAVGILLKTRNNLFRPALSIGRLARNDLQPLHIQQEGQTMRKQSRPLVCSIGAGGRRRSITDPENASGEPERVVSHDGAEVEERDALRCD